MPEASGFQSCYCCETVSSTEIARGNSCSDRRVWCILYSK